MPGHFIAIFQLYARIFHCDFSIVCLGKSLQFFNCMPGYCIAIFQINAWVFLCNFSNLAGIFLCNFSIPALGISLTSCLKGLFLNGDGTYLYLPNQKLRNISATRERAPLFFFGPYNYIIIGLNKP